MQNRQVATGPALGTIVLGLCVLGVVGCDTSRQGLRLASDAGVFAGDGAGGAAGLPVTTGGSSGLSTGVAGSSGGVAHGTGGTSIGGTAPSGIAGSSSDGAAIGTAGAIGGAQSSGGLAPVGGAVSTDGAVSTGGAVTVAPATVAESGFVTVSTGTVQLSGYIASSTAGSGSSIALTYGTDEFCATGVVAPNSTYKSWASTGFNVNQQASGASGSTQSLALVGTTVSLRYVNRGGATLEFQLFDGSQYWCYYLPPAPESTTFSFLLASLNTQCWDGKGTAFQSGTAIVSVNLAVPGASNSKTPFDYCFQGMSVD